MRIAQNYTVDEKFVDIINDKSKKSGKSKSEILNGLISLGLGYPSDMQMLQTVANEVEDLRKIVSGIYNIHD